ncbi:MAG: aldo/keto reductase [Cellvibrionaceae bacterium]|nr:aldo/keto reductase [Cellvibrionaceae bacterium]
MRYTRLTASDLSVSFIGLGTVKIGRTLGVKYPRAFRLPDDNAVLDVLNTAAACGINLIDTAPAYGSSEARLGALLTKTTPHDWLVATKVGEVFDSSTGQSHYNFTPEFIRASIEQSCRRLRRPTLDIVLIHSNGDDRDIIQRQGALAVLKDLQREGKIRASGMSTKTVEGGLLAVDHSDIVMLTHNLTYREEQAVIDYATTKNKGIFIKKAFASGHLSLDNAHNNKTNNNDKTNNIQKTFELIQQNPGVSSVVLGSINPQHIRQNVACALAAS